MLLGNLFTVITTRNSLKPQNKKTPSFETTIEYKNQFNDNKKQ